MATSSLTTTSSEHPECEMRIPLAEPNIGPGERESVDKCLADGWVSTAGPYVPRFERAFADYIGAEDAVAMVNGTCALQVALRLVGVHPDDPVIVPALTFIASATPVAHIGARVVPVDVCQDTACLDAAKLGDALSKLQAQGTPAKAIVAVHLYGHPADMDAIGEMADRYGVPVVEDATESLGAKYRGRHTGVIGDIGCFSFNGNKIMTTGGGGMLVSRREGVVERARHQINQARTDTFEFDHDEIGYNFRLTSLQAALGMAQLRRMGEFLASKRRSTAFYAEHLTHVPGLTVLGEVGDVLRNAWMPVVLIDPADFGADARGLIRRLADRDIESRPLFKPLHLMPMFDGSGELEQSEWLWRHGLNLPASTNITDEQLKTVVSAVRDIHAECAR